MMPEKSLIHDTFMVNSYTGREKKNKGSIIENTDNQFGRTSTYYKITTLNMTTVIRFRILLDSSGVVNLLQFYRKCVKCQRPIR